LLTDGITSVCPTISLILELGMIKNHDRDVKEKADTSISLETVIAMGLFGWIALSMALMGLGIW